MTAPTTPPTPGGPAPPAARSAGPAPVTPLGRLLAMFAVTAVGWSLPNTASATLAQALVAEQSPDRKVALFAVVSTVGAVSAMVCTIVGGAWSDRTRSRFGRRTPWIVGGALVAVPGLLVAAITPSLPVLVAGYALFQGGMNASIAGLNAVTPDRVPRDRLGVASAVAGLGYLIGLVAGTAVAAAFVEAPAAGLLAVPWVLLATALAFAAAAPDESSRDAVAPPTRWRALLPPLDRDFLLAFAGRFLTLLALLLFNTYALYIGTDHLGLDTGEAGAVIALGTLFLGAAALVTTVAGGIVSDRIGRRKPLVAGASLVMALGVTPLLVAPGVPALLVFSTLAGVGYGTYLSVDAALMVEVLPSDGDAGKDLGFLTLANTAPVVLAPGLAGGIVTLLGYGALFTALMACAIGGALCILMIRKVS
ncbi:MFS transporter [Actinomadura algeriensis]|uniref:MFS family permease n=1 Tax=Actinomadura algeriensis TaxID=1679523 RepID=A0ABR9K1G7_9ACTN|nr:MFS transporter [Actinomadura algeriensis]MBE1536371.1 MFS family permease [Actinomadura algeriensis]